MVEATQSYSLYQDNRPQQWWNDGYMCDGHIYFYRDVALGRKERTEVRVEQDRIVISKSFNITVFKYSLEDDWNSQNTFGVPIKEPELGG